MIKNRKEAGKLLATKLKDVTDPVVLAIPRGGVIVGNEIAKKLACPLDVVISKKSLPQITIIVVDDGIATGSTVFAIFNWLSKLNSKEIILAVPIMPRDTYEIMKNYVLKIISLETPDNFSAVGQFYEEFVQVSDDKVLKILSKY